MSGLRRGDRLLCPWRDRGPRCLPQRPKESCLQPLRQAIRRVRPPVGPLRPAQPGQRSRVRLFATTTTRITRPYQDRGHKLARRYAPLFRGVDHCLAQSSRKFADLPGFERTQIIRLQIVYRAISRCWFILCKPFYQVIGQCLPRAKAIRGWLKDIIVRENHS